MRQQYEYIRLSRIYCYALQELPIKNSLYVMHIERNVSDNMLKYLFGE
jgi:hypothetical protein